MRTVLRLVTILFFVSSINIINIPSANAGCQDYPESITPACVAENLAIAQVMKEAYEAAQIAKRLQEEQTARDNAAKDAADRAATIAADNALAPDDCARTTNRYLQRCTDIETARAVAENLAKDAAARAATLAADNALAPDDCARSTNRFVQSCIDAATEKARLENESKNAAEKAAIIAADSKLSLDDCARSTNRYVQRCIDIATEKARNENEAISTIQRISEIKVLQKLADDKYSLNKCDLPSNKQNQLCLDAALEKNAVKNANSSAIKSLRESQSQLSKPILDQNGEVLLPVLLISKSLSAKDISTLLSAAVIDSEDKKSLTQYSQKLNSIKSSTTAKSFKLPLSTSLDETFSSTTPAVCRIESGQVKTLKAGSCVLSIKFSTESGFEVESTKKITVKR